MRRSARCALTLLALSALVGISAGPAAAHAQVVPLRSGTQIPGGPFIHAFVPGPPGTAAGFAQGVDSEPSTITNFNGFVAVGYLSGTAFAGGRRLHMDTDMRVMQGEFILSDGTRTRGTYVFV